MNVFEAMKSIEKPYINFMLNKHLCDSLQQVLKDHFGDDPEYLKLDLKTVYKVSTSKM